MQTVASICQRLTPAATLFLAISKNMKIMNRDGTVLDEPFCGLNGKKWRRRTKRSVLLTLFSSELPAVLVAKVVTNL